MHYTCITGSSNTESRGRMHGGHVERPDPRKGTGPRSARPVGHTLGPRRAERCLLAAYGLPCLSFRVLRGEAEKAAVGGQTAIRKVVVGHGRGKCRGEVHAKGTGALEGRHGALDCSLYFGIWPPVRVTANPPPALGAPDCHAATVPRYV